MELNTPFYVKLSESGPNNSQNINYLHHLMAVYKDKKSPQLFKVVIIDEEDKYGTTYITEDGYCLWPSCVQMCTEQEYMEERNLTFIPLIWN